MENMSGYNEAKMEILNLAKTMGEITSLDIADLTDRRYENASVLLLSYFRYGLLGRRRLKGTKAFGYWITEKGITRLDWLNQVEEEDDPGTIPEEEEDLEEESEEEFEELF